MPALRLDKLAKTFHRRSRPAGGLGRLSQLFRPSRPIEVPAVIGVSFAVEAGERVAFIGPNGAGKSTTLKMLTGMLTPSAGHAEVAGLVPWQARRRLASRIGIVFGQRSQLWPQLPVADSFWLLARIYGVSRAAFLTQKARLTHAFAIGDFMDRPASQLSLGQRMRCEIAAALLHGPGILFLDEPTIGLDVTAKAALRDHLNELSRADATTVLLTSHDTGDIEKICERVIVIDHGRLIMDVSLDKLRRDYLGRRMVTLTTAEEEPLLALDGVEVAARAPYRLSLAVDTARMPIQKVVAEAMERLTIQDLMIENPPLEDVIKAIYRGDRREPAEWGAS
ncbi:MAG: ATP-binding cassette domain-containing protein [Proteobacteria bacterium]|nr:ATP-binding cassette domain-containing protein [Pseudomonadota bacterium]MBI3497045.1 ATP-binding cassette domain-containing protein [Pseudomonadota bacterium]